MQSSCPLLPPASISPSTGTSCGHCRTRSGRWTSGFGCYGRAGGPIVVDSQADVSALPEPLDNARKSSEYAAIGDRLPFPGGWPREEIEKLFAAHHLINIA